MAKAKAKKGFTIKTKLIVALIIFLALVIGKFRIGAEGEFDCIRWAGHGVCLGVKID